MLQRDTDLTSVEDVKTRKRQPWWCFGTIAGCIGAAGRISRRENIVLPIDWLRPSECKSFGKCENLQAHHVHIPCFRNLVTTVRLRDAILCKDLLRKLHPLPIALWKSCGCFQHVQPQFALEIGVKSSPFPTGSSSQQCPQLVISWYTLRSVRYSQPQAECSPG